MENWPQMLVEPRPRIIVIQFNSVHHCRKLIILISFLLIFLTVDDCGLFAICLAEEVCKGLLENRENFYDVKFTGDHAFNTRGRIKMIIRRLANADAHWTEKILIEFHPSELSWQPVRLITIPYSVAETFSIANENDLISNQFHY